MVAYVLLRNPDKQPAAAVLYTVDDAGGQPNFALISTFVLVYSVPVVAQYLFVTRQYGFVFQGGIDGQVVAGRLDLGVNMRVAVDAGEHSLPAVVPEADEPALAAPRG
jgi:hypothetical protein